MSLGFTFVMTVIIKLKVLEVEIEIEKSLEFDDISSLCVVRVHCSTNKSKYIIDRDGETCIV